MNKLPINPPGRQRRLHEVVEVPQRGVHDVVASVLGRLGEVDDDDDEGEKNAHSYQPDEQVGALEEVNEVKGIGCEET